MAFSCLCCRSDLCLFLCEKLDFFPITLKVFYRTLASVVESVVELQVILQLFYSYVLFLCYKYKACHSESGSSKNTAMCNVFTE